MYAWTRLSKNIGHLELQTFVEARHSGQGNVDVAMRSHLDGHLMSQKPYGSDEIEIEPLLIALSLPPSRRLLGLYSKIPKMHERCVVPPWASGHAMQVDRPIKLVYVQPEY